MKSSYASLSIVIESTNIKGIKIVGLPSVIDISGIIYKIPQNKNQRLAILENYSYRFNGIKVKILYFEVSILFDFILLFYNDVKVLYYFSFISSSRNSVKAFESFVYILIINQMSEITIDQI